MNHAVYSQAKRIAKGDQDIEQNILAFNHLNLQSADARGKYLSIGEQVNFMKHRASELRSGARHYVGHGHYKGNDDVYSLVPYYQGKVKIHHFDFEEQTGDGKGELTFTSSIKHLEDECLFEIDFKQFTSMLTPMERQIFTSRIAGFAVEEISDELDITSSIVRKHLCDIGDAFKSWFEMG